MSKLSYENNVDHENDWNYRYRIDKKLYLIPQNDHLPCLRNSRRSIQNLWHLNRLDMRECTDSFGLAMVKISCFCLLIWHWTGQKGSYNILKWYGHPPNAENNFLPTWLAKISWVETELRALNKGYQVSAVKRCHWPLETINFCRMIWIFDIRPSIWLVEYWNRQKLQNEMVFGPGWPCWYQNKCQLNPEF